MRAFLVCPVRGASPAKSAKVTEELEADGWLVHWPRRDTNQSDPIGLKICEENLAAIEKADIVYVIWDGKSQGCLFDLGMAFALRKLVVPISLPAATEGKSFQNMIRAWSEK